MSTPPRSACSCGRWLTPPEDGRDAQTGSLGERGDGRGDLRRELAGRSEDESARETCAALTAGCGEARHERQGEGDGLAAARASAAQEVASREGVGKGVALDREGLRLARIGENGGELGGNAEFKESRHAETPSAHE